MSNDEKIRVISDFLQSEFLDKEIADKDDFDRHSHTFRISDKENILLVTVPREIIDDNKADELPSIIQKANVTDYFQDRDIKRITITDTSVQIEKK